MLPDRRAVVFDLDDTLYPYGAFVRSGFAVLAADLESRYTVERGDVFRRLVMASTGPDAGREIQACLAALGLPDSIAPGLVARLREHAPALTLTRCARRALDDLRPAGWRIGILTNGPVDIQARKIAALELTARVDAIVYATRTGTGAGKPERDAFDAIAHALDVSAGATVFVGNDLVCDIAGASDAGMLPILCTAWTRGIVPPPGVPVISCLAEVGEAARVRLEEAARHAA